VGRKSLKGRTAHVCTDDRGIRLVGAEYKQGRFTLDRGPLQRAKALPGIWYSSTASSSPAHSRPAQPSVCLSSQPGAQSSQSASQSVRPSVRPSIRPSVSAALQVCEHGTAGKRPHHKRICLKIQRGEALAICDNSIDEARRFSCGRHDRPTDKGWSKKQTTQQRKTQRTKHTRAHTHLCCPCLVSRKKQPSFAPLFAYFLFFFFFYPWSENKQGSKREEWESTLSWLFPSFSARRLFA